MDTDTDKDDLEVSTEEDNLRQLELERNKNDQKLKARFEYIFRKYERDFTGVGDEIEIASGEIVVNNGHLQHMRHEVDPGKSASSRFVRTFQEKLEHEDEEDSDVTREEGGSSEDNDDEDEGEDEDGDDEDGDGDSIVRQARTPSATLKATKNDMFSQDLRRALEPLGHMARPAPRLAHLLVGEGTSELPLEFIDEQSNREDASMDSVSGTATPSNTAPQSQDMHSLMLGITKKASRSVDEPDAIQALGASIANQLAQLMAGASKQRKRKKPHATLERRAMDSAWNYPESTRLEKHERGRTSSPEVPQLPTSPSLGSPGMESIWAPEASVRLGKRRRLGTSDVQARPTPAKVDIDHQVPLSSSNRSLKEDVRRCWNCSLLNTRTWHTGPHGQDLCDSCGKYFRYNRCMKPFDSPTPPTEGQDQGEAGNGHGNGHEIEDLAGDEAEVAVAEKESRRSLSENAKQRQRQWRVGKRTLPSLVDIEGGQKLQGDQDDKVSTDSTTRHLSGHDTDGHPQRTRQDATPYSEPEETHIAEEIDNKASYYPANTSRTMASLFADTKKMYTRYTPEEDAQIIMLKEIGKLSWEAISGHMGRSAFSLQRRYCLHLGQPDCAGRRILATQEQQGLVSSTMNDVTWDNGQDEVLLNLRKDENLGWDEIAALMPGRSSKIVEQRYALLAGVNRVQNEQPAVARTSDRALLQALPTLVTPIRSHDRFTADEDAALVRLREIEGLGWAEIARRCPDRGATSLQGRYARHLAPDKRKVSMTLPNDPIQGTLEDRILAVDPELGGELGGKKFTPEEDALIRDLKEVKHFAWTQIAARLPGRSPTLVKHRYLYKTWLLISQLHDASIKPANMLKTSRSRPRCINSIASGRQSKEGTGTSSPATMNSSGRSGPGARKPFTHADNDVILRMLHDENRAWEEIAFHLPGRSVASISAHYTEHLQHELNERMIVDAEEVSGSLRDDPSSAPPQDLTQDQQSENNTLPQTKPSQHTVQSSSSSSSSDTTPKMYGVVPQAVTGQEMHHSLAKTDSSVRRWSQEDCDLLVKLREQGVKWRQIPDHMPGRTASSALSYYHRQLRPVPRRGSGQRFLPMSQESNNDLRRQAMGNNSRGHSDMATSLGTDLSPEAHEDGCVQPKTPSIAHKSSKMTIAQLVVAAFDSKPGATLHARDIYEWVENNYELRNSLEPKWKVKIRSTLSKYANFQRSKTAYGYRGWQRYDTVDLKLFDPYRKHIRPSEDLPKIEQDESAQHGENISSSGSAPNEAVQASSESTLR